MYFNALRFYYDGDYDRAGDVFQTAARLGRQSVDGHWVDGVCYHSMMGECFYRTGQLDQALEEFDTALRIFLRHRKWMLRVQFPPQIAPDNTRARDAISWARRETVPGRYGSYRVLFGDLNAGQALQSGGVFAPPEFRPVNVTEIMRCLAVAIQRRNDLLGPLVRYDALTSQLLSALGSPLVAVNHWSQVWVDVPRGLMLSAVGKLDDARLVLTRGALIQGRYDHPLTAIALLELGRIEARGERFQAASEWFLQASAAAAEFEQLDLVAECFDHLHRLHLRAELTEPHPAFSEALSWANRYRARLLRTQLLVNLAEQFLAISDTSNAIEALTSATKGQGRRPRISAQLESRQSLLEAILNYHQHKIDFGDRALEKALSLQRQVSPWLFQLNTTNRLYEASSERITPRVASALYQTLLREPGPTDWRNELLDSLVMLTTPLTEAHENWFEVALERSDEQSAIAVIQQMKRRQFLARLPLGGRLLALRWTLEAPMKALAPSLQRRRDELMDRFPDYANKSRAARDLRRSLAELPVHDDDQQAIERRTDLSEQLAELSAQQEHLIAHMALMREPVPLAFPPRRSVKEIQARLNPAQVIWGFSHQTRGLYAYMLSAKYVTIWEVERPKVARKTMVELLNQLGMRGANQPMTITQLSDTRWQISAQRTLDTLLEQHQRGFWKRFEELIIIPDSFLWYLPFEILRAEDEELISKMRVRYAPLLALTIPDARPPRRHVQTVTAIGKLFPRELEEEVQDHFAQMQGVVSDLYALPTRLGGNTGLLRSVWHRLLVLDDIEDIGEAPLAWSPGRVDGSRPGNTLADWLRLPWGAPDQILLPGFHTGAETAGAKGNGSEVFMTIMGLMGTGARTVLIARWRTGGETSYDLMQEWLQECDLGSAAEAWQRAIQVVRQSEVDPAWEPRVNARPEDPVVKAEHPFLWAGYILADTGVRTPQPLIQRPSTATPSGSRD